MQHSILKEQREVLRTKDSKQTSFIAEQKQPSPRTFRVNNFISEPKVICQQIPKTVTKQNEFTQTLNQNTLQLPAIHSQDVKSKSYLAEASVVRVTPRKLEQETQQPIPNTETDSMLKIEVNNADFVKLMSAYETLKRIDNSTKIAQNLTEQTTLLKTTKLNNDENSCDENEQHLIALFELITSKNENYAVVLKSLLKEGDQASVLRSLDGFVKGFGDELAKTTSANSQGNGHEWSKIEREIELQEAINDQLQLQINRMTTAVQLLEEESEVEQKIAEFVQERQNLTDQMADLDKTKQTLQQQQQSIGQNLDESNATKIVSRQQFDTNFEHNLIYDNFAWFQNTPTLTEHLESKYQQVLQQRIPSISEFDIKSSQKSTEQLTTDRLSKLISMYHSRQSEVTKMEAELNQLEIEEQDAEELNKVLQTLSFKHIRKHV